MNVYKRLASECGLEKEQETIRQNEAACVKRNMRSMHEMPNVSASAAREWRASVEGRTRERPPDSSVERARGRETKGGAACKLAKGMLQDSHV